MSTEARLSYSCIAISQPIGEFYLTAIPAEVLLSVVTVKERRLTRNDDGVQRKLNQKRVSEIAMYATDPDATFPTPIILACTSEKIFIEKNSLGFDPGTIIGEVIDGQHRVLGLVEAHKNDAGILSRFVLPVVVMLDLEPYEKAYVFSTINSKQTPVPRSLIYDLFDLSETRSPYKTCHEIARTLNGSESSPFFCGLKMLGTRVQETEYLTQGSFVGNLVKLISKKPQADEISVKSGLSPSPDETLPFRKYWLMDKDEVIVRILENYFGAIRDQFPEQWNYPTADRYILRKTVGFAGLLLALQAIWPEVTAAGKADREFFAKIAARFCGNLRDRPLTAQMFGSSMASAGRLRNVLIGEE